MFVDKIGSAQAQIPRAQSPARAESAQGLPRSFKPVEPVTRRPTPEEQAALDARRDGRAGTGGAMAGERHRDRPPTEFELARQQGRPGRTATPSRASAAPAIGRPPPPVGLSAPFLAQQMAAGGQAATTASAGATAELPRPGPGSQDWRRGHALYQQVQETGAPGGFSKPDGVDYLPADDAAVGHGLNLKA